MELERNLPKDMIQEILGRLSNHDLFQYGCASKCCLQSTNDTWKMRYQTTKKYFENIMEHSLFSLIQNWENKNDTSDWEFDSESSENKNGSQTRLDFGLSNINKDLFWYKMYNKILNFSIINVLYSYIYQCNTTDSIELKPHICDRIFKIVYDYKIIFSNQRFKRIDFERYINMKLHEFIFGSEYERRIAHKYYPLLFLEEYETLMNGSRR